MRKSVKMADIAERLGVSVVTVSKALSGQKGVSEEMRARIKNLAEEMGYQSPSKEKQTAKSYNFGVLVPNRYLADTNSFYWKIYQEVAARAAKKSCFVLFETVSEAMEESGQLPRLLEEKKVDGLIVIGKPAYGYEDTLRDKSEVPLVFIDFYVSDGSVDCVISDGFYGAYVLTNYLFEKGHKDIAYVGTLFATESITDRYMGYVKSLMEHGVQPREDYLIPDRDLKTGEIFRGEEYPMPKKMPTAFVCNCDFIAGFFVKALKERGFRVPEDVSVVGYDNYMYPGLNDVEVTTFELDFRQMAKEAVYTLLKILKGEPYRKGIHVVEGSLIEKESVLENK